MQVLLQTDQRPKQNHKDVPLPVHPQELYILGKELGPVLNQEEYSLSDYPVSKKLIHLLRHGSLPRDRRWSDRILENKRSSSESISCILDIGLMKSGRASCQGEEDTRKDFNTVLIRQNKKFCTSELSKVIQDAIFFILHYRRMS